MEGNTSHWYNFWRKNFKNPSWKDFQTALTRRFGGKERDSIFEKLARLRQKGRGVDYIQEFEILVAQTPQASKELLGYCFAGLQTKMRNMIRPHNPKDVMKPMEVALDLEETIIEDRKGGYMFRNSNTR